MFRRLHMLLYNYTYHYLMHLLLYSLLQHNIYVQKSAAINMPIAVM